MYNCKKLLLLYYFWMFLKVVLDGNENSFEIDL